MSTWDELRSELLELLVSRPGVLLSYPTPEAGDRQPPFRIRVASGAADVAAALHDEFGDALELQVGALAYPLQRDQRSPLQDDQYQDRRSVDQAIIGVLLDGPLIATSGQTVRHTLLLTNHSDVPIEVQTCGYLIARIVDPDSGTTIGGYSGGHLLPLITFLIAPNERVPIPLLVGTSSFNASLGCSVPAGERTLYATLELSDGTVVNTPLLSLSVQNP